MDVVINCDIILHSIWNGQPDNINEMRQVIKMPNDSSDSPWSDSQFTTKIFRGIQFKKKIFILSMGYKKSNLHWNHEEIFPQLKKHRDPQRVHFPSSQTMRPGLR